MTSLESPIIAVINHLLVRQPMLCAKLRAHAGGVACLELGTIQLKLAVAADGLFQLAETAEPNVTIRIKPADLPQVMMNMEKAFSYVSISGDADFARTISEMANELHWEPEEDLAPFLGDIAAVRITQAVRTTLSHAKSGGRKFFENMAEYLLEENPTLLYRQTGEQFASDVAIIRDDVERLAKRIASLEKQSVGGQA
jgi:ubiquinone biosynthesis accessory factor UbiJ